MMTTGIDFPRWRTTASSSPTLMKSRYNGAWMRSPRTWFQRLHATHGFHGRFQGCNNFNVPNIAGLRSRYGELRSVRFSQANSLPNINCGPLTVLPFPLGPTCVASIPKAWGSWISADFILLFSAKRKSQFVLGQFPLSRLFTL